MRLGGEETVDQKGAHRGLLKTAWSIGLFLAGISVLTWILWSVGLQAIQANLSAVGASWFVLLIGLFLFAQLAFFAGWWVLIDPPLRVSSWLRLFGVYLAGDSINYLVASGNLAGEPLKAHLLRHSMGFGQALTSITVHKHAEIAAEWLFLIAGLAVCVAYFHLPLAVTLLVVGMIVALGASLLLLTWALRKGTFSPALRRITAWVPQAVSLRAFQPSADALDARIREVYDRQPALFLWATGWCLLGFCSGYVETYIILRLLAPTEGWATAVAIETLARALNHLFVFVPGRVGVAEGVRVGVFMLLGLPAAQGLAYGLVRRGRELVWVVPGLLVLLMRQAAWFGQPRLSPSPEKRALP